MRPIREKIEAAFAEVAYPGDENITRCPYHCSECVRVAEFFKGRTWTGNTVDELKAQHTALALFTPEAFQYFLPGYMLASMGIYEKGDTIPDAIRFHFEYTAEVQGHYQVKLSKFTRAQREAIIEYLVYMERKGAGSSEHAIGMLSEESEVV